MRLQWLRNWWRDVWAEPTTLGESKQPDASQFISDTLTPDGTGDPQGNEYGVVVHRGHTDDPRLWRGVADHTPEMPAVNRRD